MHERMEIEGPKSATVIKKSSLPSSFIRVLMVSALGSVQYGYSLWIIYSPTVLIQKFYNVTGYLLKPIPNEQQHEIFMLGATVSLFPLGGVIGALVVGPLVDTHGRKGTVLFNSFFSLMASLFMVCASIIQSYAFTMFARFLIGISIGIFSTVIPMYLGEIAPVNLRGIVGVLPHVCLTVGVELAQLLSFREVIGTNGGQPILMSLTGILALFQVIIVPSFPESPRYLLIQRKNEDKARAALKKLWHKDDVENEIEEIRQEIPYDRENRPMNALKLLCYRNLRWEVFSVIVLMCGQQFSGVNAVYHYTEQTYLSTGIGDENVRYLSLMTTVLIFTALLLVVCVIDTVGRRVLLVFGYGTCSIFCIALTVTLELQATVPWMSWATTAVINLYLIGNAIGPSSLPNLLITELFLQSSRSSAYVIGGCVHWLLNFFTIVTFINLKPYTGPYIFLICCPICCGTLVYVLRVIPETKGKTFLEIKKTIPFCYKRKIRSRKGSRKKISVKQDSVKQDS